MFIIVAVNSILNENFKNILINKMTNDAIAIKLPYVARDYFDYFQPL